MTSPLHGAERVLTKWLLEVGVDTGQANLCARFVLTNSDKTIYDKALKAAANWPSSFMGAVAIPEGIGNTRNCVISWLASFSTTPIIETPIRGRA